MFNSCISTTSPMPSTTPKVLFIQDSIAKEKNRGENLEKVAVGRGGGWLRSLMAKWFKTMIKRIQNHPFQIIKYPLLRGQPVNKITSRRIYSIKRPFSCIFTSCVVQWETGWKLKVHGRTWLGGSPLWKVVQDVKSYLLYTMHWEFQGC